MFLALSSDLLGDSHIVGDDRQAREKHVLDLDSTALCGKMHRICPRPTRHALGLGISCARTRNQTCSESEWASTYLCNVVLCPHINPDSVCLRGRPPCPPGTAPVQTGMIRADREPPLDGLAASEPHLVAE